MRDKLAELLNVQNSKHKPTAVGAVQVLKDCLKGNDRPRMHLSWPEGVWSKVPWGRTSRRRWAIEPRPGLKVKIKIIFRIDAAKFAKQRTVTVKQLLLEQPGSGRQEFRQSGWGFIRDCQKSTPALEGAFMSGQRSHFVLYFCRS